MLRARMSASENLCSQPHCEQGSWQSLGLPRVRVCMCVCACMYVLHVGRQARGLLPCQHVSVGDHGTQTVSSSLWPSPTRFPVLRQPDVSQMFLTSCMAPCSVCVCLFWTAH